MPVEVLENMDDNERLSHAEHDAMDNARVYDEDAIGALAARLVVIKQSDGVYRWVLFSSNAFEDREGEIVSQRALEADVARMDVAGEYGPLRWWHMGEIDVEKMKAGKGLDLGQCDFNAMHGRILVESGTFDSPIVGKAMLKHASELGASIGFFHPLDQPDKEGTYKTILRFERSLLPSEAAANGLTELAAVKEINMEDKKIETLRGLLGDEGKGLVDVLLEQAGSTEQKALEAGVRFKGETDTDGGQPESVPASGFIDRILGFAKKSGLNVEAAPEKTPGTKQAEGEVPAEAAPEGKPSVGDMSLEDLGNFITKICKAVCAEMLAPEATPKQAEGEDAPEAPKTVADLSLEELTGLVTEICKAVCADMMAGMAETEEKALGKIAKLDADLSAIKSSGESLAKIVAELVAEQPRSMAAALRASVSSETDLKSLPEDVQARLRGAGPAPDKHFTDPFLKAIKGQNGGGQELVLGGGPDGA